MTCADNCLCACQQIGCGCRDTQPKKRRLAPVGLTAPCSLCNGRGRALNVTTPAGARVVVMWCDTCDVIGGAA